MFTLILGLRCPITVGCDHTRRSRARDVGRCAIVGTDDPDLASGGPHPHVCLMELPVNVSRPIAPVAASIDGKKDNFRSRIGKLLAEMRVGHGGTLRVTPHIVADQTTDSNTVQFESTQRPYAV